MSLINCTGWPAPAKLNLFLHITGRRDDGYHNLQTVFQFVDFGDELSFELRRDGVVSRVGDVPGVSVASDLTVRAGQLLQKATGCPFGANIRIEKRLPMGGGLGGGSSDAATTLVALNILWKTGLSEDQLASLGLQLGADVPVFVRGHAAWAEGVGEHLEPVTLPEPWYLVVTPAVEVPTAVIFADPDLTRDVAPIKIRNFLSGEGFNVCEAVVCGRFPQVAEALAWLRQFSAARMTGTGSSIFASFDTRDEAEDVLAKLPPEWRGFVARGLNRSPLLDRVVKSTPEQ